MLRSPSGVLSFSCSSHHPRGFRLLSLCDELPGPGCPTMLPTLGKSHQLFLLPQGLQTQRGLVPEPCHAGCFFSAIIMLFSPISFNAQVALGERQREPALSRAVPCPALQRCPGCAESALKRGRQPPCLSVGVSEERDPFLVGQELCIPGTGKAWSRDSHPVPSNQCKATRPSPLQRWWHCRHPPPSPP